MNIQICSYSNIPIKASTYNCIYIIPFSHLDNAITFVSRMIIIGRLTCSWRGQLTSNQNMILDQKAVPPVLCWTLYFRYQRPTGNGNNNLQSAICNLQFYHACNILSIQISTSVALKLSWLFSDPAMSVDLPQINVQINVHITNKSMFIFLCSIVYVCCSQFFKYGTCALYFLVTLETPLNFHKRTKSVVEGDTAWSRGLSDSKRMED